MKVNVRLIYLYLFSFVGLLVVVFGMIRLVDLGIKAVVFKGADTYEFYAAPKIEGQIINEAEEKARQERENTRQRQREVSNSIAMIGVGLPLYLYHWRMIQKENSKNN